MASIWHIAVAVPDLDEGMAEVGEAFQVTWRPVEIAEVTLTDEHGAEHDVRVKFTFSVGGPPAIEMWEAIPSTPLDAVGDSILHHIGYWVEDLDAEGERLEERGWPCFAKAGGNRAVAIHRGPGGLMLEPCDVYRDRPLLRDLYPPDSPHYGPPVDAP